MDEKELICCKCRIALQDEQVTFSYLDSTFSAFTLKCPKCNQVFIPESVAKGRMAEVESQIEDK